MKTVISVRFRPEGKAYDFDPAGYEVKEGDYVVVGTARGVECGQVTGLRQISDEGEGRQIKPIRRLADAVDLRRMEKEMAEEKDAFAIAQKCIAARALEMKLVKVERNAEHSKLIFYFTAEERVDFRELVKDLAGELHTRIELRQIGSRDESRMKGGLGVCGRPFCCATFLKEFQPVSIKMAKAQGLSLNPGKISGACGRLLCCLGYENDAYQYLNSITPMNGSIVRTPDGEGMVVEANPISGMLKVKFQNGALAPKHYKRSECVYLRGGKHPPKAPDPEMP